MIVRRTHRKVSSLFFVDYEYNLTRLDTMATVSGTPLGEASVAVDEAFEAAVENDGYVKSSCHDSDFDDYDSLIYEYDDATRFDNTTGFDDGSIDFDYPAGFHSNLNDGRYFTFENLEHNGINNDQTSLQPFSLISPTISHNPKRSPNTPIKTITIIPHHNPRLLTWSTVIFW